MTARTLIPPISSFFFLLSYSACGVNHLPCLKKADKTEQNEKKVPLLVKSASLVIGDAASLLSLLFFSPPIFTISCRQPVIV